MKEFEKIKMDVSMANVGEPDETRFNENHILGFYL